MARRNVPRRSGGLFWSATALLLLACQGDGSTPTPLQATNPPAASPAPTFSPVVNTINAAGQTVTQGLPSAGAPPAPGVIVRLAGASAFEAHALQWVRGFAAAQTAAFAQRQTLRAQHARIIGALSQRLGGIVSRRGTGRVAGAAYDDFTDVLNGVALHGVDLATATRLLQGEPDVVSIEPITEVHTTLLDAIPLIDADDVWTLSDTNGIAIDGTGMRVGIVDTGVDYTHPDVGGCFGPGCKVAGGYDFVNHDPDPMDDHGHGTHVAATAAGNGTYTGPSGTAPIPGVAPGAQIYAYKVLGATGSGWDVDIIAGIERCADPDGDGDPSDHLDVCNLSLGGSGNPDDAMSTAIDNATASGVVFAISAGNSGPGASTIGSPGTARRAITVAAACKPSAIGVDSRCAQAIASFSSRGPVVWAGAGGTQTLAKPDVAAPGVSICAAESGTYQSGSRCLDGRHISISGTSMASPVVAGVATLLRQAHPEWTPDQVKSFILTSARDLGLDANTQGAGRIDALDALTLGGVPSSIGRIGGTPLRDIDFPTTRFASFSSAITVTNTSGETLTFTGSFAGDPGLTATLTPGSLALGPGDTGSITVARQVDHDVVPSSAEARGTITLATARGDLRVGLQVGVRDRLIAPGGADLGVDLASQTAWTGQATVQLTNTRTDAPATYNASIACCTDAFQNGGSAITASLDRTSITLAPGGTVSLTVNVQATNASLPNGRYDGGITLSSPLGNRFVRVTFFKGYGLRIDTTPSLPETLALSSAESGSTIVYPVTTPSMTFLSTTPGPFFAEAKWPGGNAPYVNHHVLASVQTDMPIKVVTLDKAQALYTFELRPKDQAGAAPSSSTAYRFTHSASGGGTQSFYGFPGSTQIRTSAIPSGINFTAGVVAFSPDPIAYFYELAGPVSADHVFTNTAADLTSKEVRVFRPASGSNSPFFAPTPCLTQPYRTLPDGSMLGGGATCTSSGLGVSLPSGVGTMRFYNAVNRDLSAAPFPDAPSISYQILDGSSAGAPLYFGPYMNVSASRSFAWNIILPYANAIRVGEASAHFQCDEPPGNVLPIGAGPMVDQWTWANYRTFSFVFRANKGLAEFPFTWGGCVQENSAALQPVGYRLFRNEALVQSGTIPLNNPLFPAAADGNHRFELSRTAVIAGVSTQVETITTFAVSSTINIDENPPRVRSLHLMGRGVWQDVIDPATVNRLRFGVDPMPGFEGYGNPPPPQFRELPDALASVSLQQSTDGATWTAVPVTLLEDGNYTTGELDVVAPLTWFRIAASDTAGNTMRHTFQVPRGTGYAPAGSDTTAPSTAITAPASGTAVTGMVAVSAVAADDVGVTRVDLFVDGVRAGSASAAPYVFNWNSAAASTGTHQLTTRAYDAAENIGVSAPVSVNIQNNDSTPPVIAFTAPAANALVRSTITLSASASDDNAVARVDFFDGATLVGSAPSAPYNVSWTTTSASDGAHALRAVAFDAAGNSASTTRQVTVDNTAPAVAITAPTDGSTVAGTVQVTATATDGIGVARVDFYDGAYLFTSATEAPYTIPWDVTFAEPGPHTLNARAVDSAGNSANAAPITVVVATDTTPPTVSITSPAPGARVSGTVQYTVAASDNLGVANVVFHDNGVPIATVTTPPYAIAWNTAATQDGEHFLMARAWDIAGHFADNQITVTVDNNVKVTMAAPAAGATVGKAVALRATTNNDGAVASMTFLDGSSTIGSVTTAPFTLTWNPTTNGTHSLKARALDRAGRTTTSAAISVTVDLTAPTVALSAPANGATVSNAVNVTATASDNRSVARVEFYRDGNVLLGSDTSSPYSISWSTTTTSAGSHTLTAVAFDTAGNTTTSATRTVVVKDVTGPTVTITSPTNGSRVNVGTVVTIAATASDLNGVSKVTFAVAGQTKCTDTTAPYTCAWTVPSGANKSYTLQATAFDAANNSRTSTAITVTSR